MEGREWGMLGVGVGRDGWGGVGGGVGGGGGGKRTNQFGGGRRVGRLWYVR